MRRRIFKLFNQALLAAPLFLLIAVSAAWSGAAHAAMEEYPVVKLRSLDKLSARTMTFEARVGSTVKFGPIYIKIQTCRKAPPIEQPESAAFLQIWEVTPQDEAKWVFSGWMFASSPALSSMDHPVYDVWVIDCLAHKTGEEPPVQPTDMPAAAEEEPVMDEGREGAAQDIEAEPEFEGQSEQRLEESQPAEPARAPEQSYDDETGFKKQGTIRRQPVREGIVSEPLPPPGQ